MIFQEYGMHMIKFIAYSQLCSVHFFSNCQSPLDIFSEFHIDIVMCKMMQLWPPVCSSAFLQVTETYEMCKNDVFLDKSLRNIIGFLLRSDEMAVIANPSKSRTQKRESAKSLKEYHRVWPKKD